MEYLLIQLLYGNIINKYGGLAMDWILYFIAFILGFTIACIGFYIKHKPKNNVHFYVARHEDGSLWLYIGKPYWCKGAKRCYTTGNSSLEFEDFGLNVNDYDNLKCEDDPVEVFVNKED